MNIDWLKITGFIIPLAALFLNFHARLKRFNNEIISVYKDLKPLSSDVGMEPHEIKVINDEIKKLILIETTGIWDIDAAKTYLKILSCNGSIKPHERSRLKKLIKCINEETTLNAEMRSHIKFKLNKIKYKKTATEGLGFLIAFILAYFAFFFGANSQLIQEGYFLAGTMYFMAAICIVASTITKAKYPFPGRYNKHNIFIDSLEVFKVK